MLLSISELVHLYAPTFNEEFIDLRKSICLRKCVSLTFQN